MADEIDDVPSLNGPSIVELQKMEGSYVFRCADCSEVFETVVDWAVHATDAHKDTFPGVVPVRKQ
jgi:uncharacterized C2H2 Zn-finger protein